MKSIPVILALAIFLPAARAAPAILSVVNAASYVGGGVAPGEIVTIFGDNLGPSTLVTQTPTDRFGTTLAGVSVLFSNIPAPLLYVSAGQIGAVVPYEVAGLSSVTVQVQYQSTTSNSVPLRVASTALGIFSANSSGSGPGAIENSDYSLNSASNPVAPGGIVMIYATGEGATAPTGVDGVLDPPLAPLPLAPISLTIGGMPAHILYAGGAPGEVAGLLQVNAVVPSNLKSCTGTALVVLSSGANLSQSNLTLQVTPSTPCTVGLDSLQFSSTQVASGGQVQGTVNLATPAPTGGLVVALSASSTAVTIPASVTIPAGASSATFIVSASSSASPQVVTIAATSDGQTVKGNLTVIAATPGFTSALVNGTFEPFGFPSETVQFQMSANADGTYAATVIGLGTATFKLIFPSATLSGFSIVATSLDAADSNFLTQAQGYESLVSGSYSVTFAAFTGVLVPVKGTLTFQTSTATYGGAYSGSANITF